VSTLICSGGFALLVEDEDMMYQSKARPSPPIDCISLVILATMRALPYCTRSLYLCFLISVVIYNAEEAATLSLSLSLSLSLRLLRIRSNSNSNRLQHGRWQQHQQLRKGRRGATKQKYRISSLGGFSNSTNSNECRVGPNCFLVLSDFLLHPVLRLRRQGKVKGGEQIISYFKH
jgi:hypothetical protein